MTRAAAQRPTSIYVASPEGETGKSTIALGILHRLTATVPKVGVFRPITRREDRDYILELLLAHSNAGLAYEDCVGVSYQRLHEDPDGAIADIVDRYHAVAARCDAMVIVGSDYTDVATPTELSVNARIAVNLGAPVVLSVRAMDRTPEEIVQVIELCLAELAAQHAHTAAVVANRCDPAQMEAVAEACKNLGPQVYVLPEEPLLVAPTVAELCAAVDGALVHGDESLLGREVMDVMVAGMTAEHVLERLSEGAAVITPGDRSDVVLAVASAHAAEGFPSLSAIILNGGLPLHREIARLVTGVGLRLPIIATDLGTFATASAVANTRGRVTANSESKIDTAIELMDRHVDIGDMLERLAIPIPTVTTPQMFAYQLMERARADRKRIVLPEGDDDRILQAAGRLLRRGLAELTILGEEVQVRSRAAELGVDLTCRDGAQPAHQRTVRAVRRAVRRTAQEEGRHPRAGPRDHPRRLLLRNHAGAQRHRRRDGVRCRAHHRPHRAPGLRDHQDPARRLHGVQHLPDVPVRPGAGLRRLRDRAGSDRRGTRRHRDQLGPHRRPVRHRPAGGHAVLLHRRIRQRRRGRQGQGGNRTGPAARAPDCWWRDRSSTTPPSTRRWRRPRCPDPRSPAAPPC